MHWPFQKKDKETTGTGKITSLPIEPAFFNVMPKAKLSAEILSEQQVTPPHISSVMVEIPKVSPVPPPVPRVLPQENRLSGATIAGAAAVLEDHTRTAVATAHSRGKVAKVAVILLALGLATFAAWYSFRTFGKTLHISSSVSGFVQSITSKFHTSKKPVVEKNNPEIKPKEVRSYNTTAEWRQQYFGSEDCEQCADDVDSDKDGLTNIEEFTAKTDPGNPDTDSDGLADGDEVNVFGCSPVNPRTAGDSTYSDSDDLKGGWNCARPTGTDDRMTEEERLAIVAKSSTKGFHEPSVATLGSKIENYQPAESSANKPSNSNVTLPVGTDISPEAVLGRDVQRSDTIKKIGAALIKYKTEIGTFPNVTDFSSLTSAIKPYNAVATNVQDPLNVAPFVYAYEVLGQGQDFALTYYSETQKQLIRYTAAQASVDAQGEEVQARDSQRMDDMEKIRAALLIYSAAISKSDQTFVFPSKSEYQQKITPQYFQTMPKDPKTGADYVYDVSKDSAAFSLKGILENPPAGTTGYICSQDECKNY